MNQKGFINIILVIIVVALVGAGAYFVSTRQVMPPTPSPTPTPSPIPTPTPNPTPDPSPNPTPKPSPTPQSQGITLLTQNTSDAFILGTRLKISWNISSKLSSNNYVLISLLGPNDSSKQMGRIVLIPVNQASGEYTWTSSAVTVNINPISSISTDLIIFTIYGNRTASPCVLSGCLINRNKCYPPHLLR